MAGFGPMRSPPPRQEATSGAMRLRSALVVASTLLLFAAACDSSTAPEGGESYLSEGDRAPGFTLPSASGEQVALADFTNSKPVLLYFSMGPG
jgi:hypothetical protein